jgi:hypothetical protein
MSLGRHPRGGDGGRHSRGQRCERARAAGRCLTATCDVHAAVISCLTTGLMYMMTTSKSVGYTLLHDDYHHECHVAAIMSQSSLLHSVDVSQAAGLLLEDNKYDANDCQVDGIRFGEFSEAFGIGRGPKFVNRRYLPASVDYTIAAGKP